MMPVDPGKAVTYSALITMGSTMGASVLPAAHGGHGGLPSFKLLFGSALTFAGLAILADMAPGLAVPLSATIAVTALTYYGVPILESYYGATGDNLLNLNPLYAGGATSLNNPTADALARKGQGK